MRSPRANCAHACSRTGVGGCELGSSNVEYLVLVAAIGLAGSTIFGSFKEALTQAAQVSGCKLLELSGSESQCARMPNAVLTAPSAGTSGAAALGLPTPPPTSVLGVSAPEDTSPAQPTGALDPSRPHTPAPQSTPAPSPGPSPTPLPPTPVTSSHQELRDKARIPHDDVSSWGANDVAWWKTFGGNEYLEDYKNDWVHGYRSIILAAAAENDIPPELLAGVAWNEVGGDPDWVDDAAFLVRDRAGKLTTSFAPMSMQIRRAAETLGYDPNTMTEPQMGEVRDSLKDPQQAIFLAARHLRALPDRDFPNTPAAALSDEQIAIVGTRYNRGPEERIETIQQNSSYGDVIVKNKANLKKQLEG